MNEIRICQAGIPEERPLAQHLTLRTGWSCSRPATALSIIPSMVVRTWEGKKTEETAPLSRPQWCYPPCQLIPIPVSLRTLALSSLFDPTGRRPAPYPVSTMHPRARQGAQAGHPPPFWVKAGISKSSSGIRAVAQSVFTTSLFMSCTRQSRGSIRIPNRTTSP